MQARIGGNSNYRVYREVNNRIREISDSFGVEGSADFLCECGSQSCLAPVRLTHAQFDGLLGDEADRVLLAALHRSSLDGERIVVEHKDFVVVIPQEERAAHRA
jgi:hypothetical protein